MAPPIVWLYKKGDRYGEYHRKAIEEAHYSQELKDAIENGVVATEIPVNLDEFGSLSLILPQYHTNSLHQNVRPGSIVLYYDDINERYYAASLVLGTGRDKDRAFVSDIWNYDNPAKTYFVCTTKPVSIDLPINRFKDLFGYGLEEQPLDGQKARYLIAPAGGHQNEFERNIGSYRDFFTSIRSNSSTSPDWVERKTQYMQEIAQTWR
jgi:hypothetical protein